MKDKIKLLIAEIRDDLDSIEKIRSDYDLFISQIDQDKPDHYQKMVLGYLMHNFYNACENIFLSVAKVFENNVEPQTWHKSILKRMKMEIEDIRPAVISEELYKILDDFRAFRHVFRHIYSYELDWEREKIVVDKFEKAVKLFDKELQDFIKKLEEIAEM